MSTDAWGCEGNSWGDTQCTGNGGVPTKTCQFKPTNQTVSGNGGVPTKTFQFKPTNPFVNSPRTGSGGWSTRTFQSKRQVISPTPTALMPPAAPTPRSQMPVFWPDILEVDFGAGRHFVKADEVFKAINTAACGPIAAPDPNQNHRVLEIDYRPGNRMAIFLMSSAEAAVYAYGQLNGGVIGGRQVSVDFGRQMNYDYFCRFRTGRTPGTNSQPSKFLCVYGIEDRMGNLSKLSVEEIMCLFFEHAKVNPLDVKPTQARGRINHHAIVELLNVEDAQKAIAKLDGLTLDTKHKLSVSFTVVDRPLVPRNNDLLQRKEERRQNSDRSIKWDATSAFAIENKPEEGEKEDESKPEEEGEKKDENKPEEEWEKKDENRPEEEGEKKDENRPEEEGEKKDESKPEEEGEKKDESKPEEEGEKRDENKPEEEGEKKDESKPEEEGEKKDESKPEEEGEKKDTVGTLENKETINDHIEVYSSCSSGDLSMRNDEVTDEFVEDSEDESIGVQKMMRGDEETKGIYDDNEMPVF